MLPARESDDRFKKTGLPNSLTTACEQVHSLQFLNLLGQFHGQCSERLRSMSRALTMDTQIAQFGFVSRENERFEVGIKPSPKLEISSIAAYRPRVARGFHAWPLPRGAHVDHPDVQLRHRFHS
ncbi:hypothetical protein NL676_008506 [Syzygium grande]|nr:hypothetical protein NL676_008506 [Syzygium grande]